MLSSWWQVVNQAVPWALPFFGLSVVVGVLVGIAGRRKVSTRLRQVGFEF